MIPSLRADFHLHSTFSDGLFPPEALCLQAQKAGVSALALTDHDTAEGIPAFARAAREAGLSFLPGAEVSCGEEGRTHLLLYGGVEESGVKAFLDSIRQGRLERGRKMVALLEKEGIVLSEEARKRLSVPNVGRAHVARELVACGAVHTIKQAFDRYLEAGRSCYVGRELLTAGETLKYLRGFPVVPVLAHPMELKLEPEARLAFLQELAEEGLQGVECFHPSATHAQGTLLEHFARSHGLLVTGGSDYHGEPGTHIGRIGHGWINQQEDTEALLDAVSRKEADSHGPTGQPQTAGFGSAEP